MNPLLQLTDEDQHTALTVLAARSGTLQPDLTIGTDAPYLYRWHVIPRNEEANVYLHLQVGSDPDRPLHDHPWDNTSVILAGGYNEVMVESPSPRHRRDVVGWNPTERPVVINPIRTGEVRHRVAEQPHRLVLPQSIPYTLTLFSTGPVRRDWGFWCKEGWRSHKLCTRVDENGRSIWVAPDRELA